MKQAPAVKNNPVYGTDDGTCTLYYSNEWTFSLQLVLSTTQSTRTWGRPPLGRVYTMAPQGLNSLSSPASTSLWNSL